MNTKKMKKKKKHKQKKKKYKVQLKRYFSGDQMKEVALAYKQLLKASHIRLKMGAKKDGRIVAAEAKLMYEAGAFPGSPVTAGGMLGFTGSAKGGTKSFTGSSIRSKRSI